MKEPVFRDVDENGEDVNIPFGQCPVSILLEISRGEIPVWDDKDFVEGLTLPETESIGRSIAGAMANQRS